MYNVILSYHGTVVPVDLDSTVLNYYSCATNGFAMGSRPSSGETRLTCVPRTTTRPSFLVLSNTRSESSGSGPGHFEVKKKERYHGTKCCCEIYVPKISRNSRQDAALQMPRQRCVNPLCRLLLVSRYPRWRP